MAESFSRVLKWIQDNVAALGILIALVTLLLTVLGAVGGGAWRLATTLTALGENIDELRTTVGRLSSDVGELGTTVGTLSNDVGALRTAVDTLSSDVGELRTAVDTLSSGVEPDENIGGVTANVLTEFTQATRCLAALSTSPEWEENIAAGLGAPDAPPAPPLGDQRPRRVMPEECRALKQQP